MINSKKAKRFQFWINVVLILITLSIVLPFVRERFKFCVNVKN